MGHLLEAGWVEIEKEGGGWGMACGRMGKGNNQEHSRMNHTCIMHGVHVHSLHVANEHSVHGVNVHNTYKHGIYMMHTKLVVEKLTEHSSIV